MAETQCAINIGPRERRKRLVFGAAMFTVSVAAAIILLTTGAPRWWRLGLAFPLWLSMLGFLQAREKT
jgi:hypothetical protein